MWSIRTLRFLVASAILAAPGLALGQEPSAVAAAPETPPEGAFAYPLRAGESLSDVSRIFRVPVSVLVERNRLGNVDRLQVGQRLLVPNAFAEQAAAYAAERDAAVAERARVELEAATASETIAELEATIAELERETGALEARISTLGHWENAAQIGALAVLAFFLWTLKIGHDRSVLARRLRSVAVENEALTIARAKAREALSHLELRYQNLYSGKGGGRRKIVVDGVAAIERAFEEGSRQLERYATKIEREREREEQLLDAQQKMLGWLFHPVREMLSRYRLKEHTP